MPDAMLVDENTKRLTLGNSLAVKWLGLGAFIAAAGSNRWSGH